jgi:hypothetical protein
MEDESLHQRRAAPSAVTAAVDELAQAVFSSAGATAAGKAASTADEHDRVDGPPLPPGLEAFDASSPPRVFSRVLSSERLALRPMLPTPMALRSMPFEVIQSTLQRHTESTSALMANSDVWASSGRALSHETLAPLSPTASSQKLIVVPSPSQTWLREENVAHRLPSRRGSGHLAVKAADDGPADGGVGAQTIIESCESYLSLLRQQQQRLRDQRDEQQRLYQQPPPVAGWYAIKSPAFGTNLQRARSWAEPSEMDWWRAQ